jgi:hypothetical protein
MKLSNRLKRIKENGKTYLHDEDTGEKVQVWSDEVRALRQARKARRVETENAKPNFWFTKGGARIKKSSRVREPKPDNWRTCDAMRYGRVCKKWQKLRQTEFNFLDLPYRCRECTAANFDTDPDFKPIGPDGE